MIASTTDKLSVDPMSGSTAMTLIIQLLSYDRLARDTKGFSALTTFYGLRKIADKPRTVSALCAESESDRFAPDSWAAEN